MELDAHVPRMVRKLHDLHQTVIRIDAGYAHASFGDLFEVDVVELVSVTVPFVDLLLAIRRISERILVEAARIAAQPHGAPMFVMFFCSGIRSIYGNGVSEQNSVELASRWPSTLRANSMTASCIPRQMPKNGTLLSCNIVLP